MQKDLKHYGVLGMRWGKRRANGGGSVSVGRGPLGAAKEIAGLTKDAIKDDIEKITSIPKKLKGKVDEIRDKNWQEKSQSVETYVKVHNAAARRANAEVVNQVNNKPEYKDKNFNDPKNADLYKKYLKEQNDGFDRIFKEEAIRIIGTSPTGKLKATIKEEEDGVFTLSMEEVKHSDEPSFKFKLIVDSLKHIIGIEMIPEDGNLKHWGVLGMKWGVRKRGPASADHTTARELKKKSLEELSNDDIRKITTRLQLERQLKNITQKEKSVGMEFVSKLLRSPLGVAALKYAFKVAKSKFNKSRGMPDDVSDDVVDAILLEEEN